MGLARPVANTWPLPKQPAHMCPPFAVPDGVRVGVTIGVAVVNAVVVAPNQDRVLERSRTEQDEAQPDGQAGLIGAVREESVVAAGDGHTGGEVVGDGKNKRLPAEIEDHVDDPGEAHRMDDGHRCD